MPPLRGNTRFQPSLTPAEVGQVEALAQQGNLSDQQIADAVGTSRKTARKYIDIGRAAGRVPPAKPALTGVAARPIPQTAARGAAGSPADADYLISVPKAFQMDTRIVFQAMEAARNEWNWPIGKLTPGDFIDTVLFLYFQDRRIILAGYVKLGEGDRLVLPDMVGPKREEAAGRNGVQNGAAAPQADAAPDGEGKEDEGDEGAT